MKYAAPILLTLALLTTAQLPAHAEALALKTSAAALPEAVSEAVGALLQETALELADEEGTAFTFWLCKELPLIALPADAKSVLENIPPTTVLGVVDVARDMQRDYRDDEIYPDPYTLRFGLQPENDDHEDTSQYRYFAVLVPAAMDTDPAGLRDHEAMVDASADDTATAHPAILSLRPVMVPGGETPKLTTPVEDHKSLRVALPATTEDGESTTIEFEIVYEGHGKM